MLKNLESFSLPELEEKVLAFWRERGVFGRSVKAREGGKEFVFYEGPPTANGRPGIHHVLARGFKDVILRYKTMRGFHVPRRAGWDTHGLPVELEVEKQLGLKSKKEIEAYGIAAFNRACRESVWKYKDEWEKLTERIGFWLDMGHPYITYENDYMESLWHILAGVWKKRLLYKGHKVVPWCTRCGTALSSHELAQGYKEVTENSVFLKFKVKSSKLANGEPVPPNTYILSWTTTPWTLPGNVALAVGKSIEYSLVKAWDETLILASARLGTLKVPYEVSATVAGKELLGLEYVPLFDIAPFKKEKAAYRVYPADFVTTSDGTGVVHTAVMYGEDDYRLGKEVGLPEFHTVGLDGKFVGEVPGLAGMRVKDKESDEKIFEHLKKEGFFFATENYTHDYPFCWRCSTPLLYYARDSWFIRMSDLRKDLMKENERINWVPSHLQNGRFGEWVKEVKDWAISRERYWGTPLPLWVCDECGHTHAVGSVADLEALLPKARNRYLFMRHGEAEQNVANIADTAPGSERFHLTLRGRTEVEEAARKLEKKGIDLIVASNLMRTKETADIVGAALKKTVHADARLAEINVGDFDGQSVELYRSYYSSDIEKFTKRPPNGESLTDLCARMFACIAELEAKHEGKTILIVTHEYPVWMAHASLLGWSDTESVERKNATEGDFIGYAEVVEVPFRSVPRDETGRMDLHRPYIDAVTFACPECTKGTMQRIPEVVDVWFDSGAMPLAQNHYPFEKDSKRIPYPADYISEAIDQTRGWFYTLLAEGVLAEKGTPFKNVICLGHVLDKAGQKMSKSKGNVVSPWDMTAKYGADAIRWYFYTVNAPGEPKLFDEAELGKVVRQFVLMLYNSLVFFQTYAGPAPETAKDSKPNVLDRWVRARLAETVEVATGALDAYDPGSAARTIGLFVDDLSRWYIRRSRRRFQRPESAEDFAHAAVTLRHCLETTAKLLAPFMPFFAEGLWTSLEGSADSVHLADWPKLEKKDIDSELLKGMATVRNAASVGLALRASAGRKVRQPLASLTLKTGCSDELKDILKDEVNVKEVLVNPAAAEEVTLDTVLTHELEEEGWRRELTRSIQDLRQDADCSPKDTIALYLVVPEELEHVVSAHREAFCADVRASGVEFSRPASFDAELATKLGDWEVWIGLVRS